MLVVTGVIEISPEGAETAEAAAVRMMAETVREPGCLVYEFSRVLGSDTRFRVYEEWQDDAALEAHFNTPHMAEFRAALGSVGIVSRDICKFEGGDKVPLG